MADLIRIGCPKCKAVVQVKPESAGAVVACPKCATRMKVPAARVPAPAESSEQEEQEPIAPPPQVALEGVGAKFSLPAIVYLAVSTALLLASGFLIYTSSKKWAFKSNITEALRKHDGLQIAHVGSACEAALRWNSTYVPAKELQAKVLVETGALDQAETVYLSLANSGRHSVQAGLGAIYLRKADREKDPNTALQHVARAQDYYKQAGSIPEGGIGQGLCTLMISSKKKDKNLLKDARAQLERALVGAGGQCSREGLLDAYAALGSVLAQMGDDPKAASEYCNRAAQFSPAWNQPSTHIILLRAKNIAENPITGEAYKQRHAELKQELTENIERTNNKILYGDLVPAVNELTAAMVIIFMQNGDFDPVARYSQMLRQNTSDLYATLTALSVAWVRALDPKDVLVRDHVNRLAMSWTQELVELPEMKKPENAASRSIAYNNLAAYKEYMVFAMNMEKGDYPQPLGFLAEALRSDPANYAAHRNMAVFLKRNYLAETKNAEKKRIWGEQCQQAFAKAQENAQEPWMKTDVEKVREFCSRP